MTQTPDIMAVSQDWLAAALGTSDLFPWQTELLRRLTAGAPPRALDIPTGLGKTSVMAIWLVARVCGAKLPRRLVYVVDRRVVVDQATEVAEQLRLWIQNERPAADALGIGGRPLPISTLRGQHADNRQWLEDPSAPAIVVGTVDMIGSRLLFEGYRCSRKMRPYHAALLGADALIVLDEAHLVPAFETMVRTAVEAETFMARPELRVVVPRSCVMSLSATGRQTAATLGLSELDYKHKVVKRRLDAPKRIRITEPTDARTLATTLASKAWELTDEGRRPSRVIVFVDSREIATEICEAIAKLARGDGTQKIEIEPPELFVGGRRIAERESAASRLADLGLIAGSKHKPAKPVFVVATSAGEVGVDLDAEHAVLDLVEWERMVQRLGRVNRRGEGVATVWIVPPALDDKTKDALAKDAKIRSQKSSQGDSGASDDDEDDDTADDKPIKKLKEEERARVERWHRKEQTLRAIRNLPCSDGAHDGSPQALTDLKKKAPTLLHSGSTRAPLHPELTRAVLQAWSMTSLEAHTGRPNVRPWLRGWVEEDPQTTVVWRKWVPRAADAKAFFEAAPVETAESLETESWRVLEWLFKRIKQVSKAIEEARNAPKQTAQEAPPADDGAEAAGKPAALDANQLVMFVLDESPRSWTLAELSGLDKKERDYFLREISGRTLVMDLRFGGLSQLGLLDPQSDSATDVSEVSAETQSSHPRVGHTETSAASDGDAVVGDVPADQTIQPFRLSFRVHEVNNDELEAFAAKRRVEEVFVSRVDDEGEVTASLVVETDPTQQSTTADGRSTGKEQPLAEHQVSAESHARRIGDGAGLSGKHLELLALAALLHDEGKRAVRWQRAFRAPKDKRPLGKTKSWPIQSILAGYRHELGSLLDAKRDSRVGALPPDDRDLLLHLIAAHHGFARPILRTDGCEHEPPSALVERAREIALRFVRLEKQWGPWGLAWWETLLRAADQAASRENDERGGARG